MWWGTVRGGRRTKSFACRVAIHLNPSPLNWERDSPSIVCSCCIIRTCFHIVTTSVCCWVEFTLIDWVTLHNSDLTISAHIVETVQLHRVRADVIAPVNGGKCTQLKEMNRDWVVYLEGVEKCWSSVTVAFECVLVCLYVDHYTSILFSLFH